MKLRYLGFLLAAVVVLVVAKVAFAQGSPRTFSLPPSAKEIAPAVFDLGTVVKEGKKLQGFAFVHYKDGNSHKPNHVSGGSATSNCYSFLARGARWKTVEPWVVNPVNTRNLSGDFVLTNLTADIAKWEDAAAGKDILGNGSITSDTLVADTSSPDNLNEAYFANVESSGAIAVTIVWGIFFGPPSGRELVEWDQVYDDVDFDWSTSGEAGKMDFENIATHELGHSDGMGHPSDSCTEETMYRFAGFGETKKRDLHTGDIAGIKKLYE